MVLPEPFGPIRPNTCFSASLKRHILDRDEAAEVFADGGGVSASAAEALGIVALPPLQQVPH